MTLRTKLLLSTSLEILLVITISVFLINSSQRINRTKEKEAKAIEIVETVSQIRFVTFENLLYQDKRSFEQWQLKHSDLILQLEPTPTQNAAERQILLELLEDSRDVNLIFNRLVADYSELPFSQETSSREAFQQRLSTRLLAKQQSQISKAFDLTDMAREEVAVLIKRSNTLVGAVILLMFAIMAVNFFFIAGTIAKALAVFQKAAEEIASGKFDYRINTRGHKNDELGRLAAAFNSMAASLEEIDKVKADLILLASHQLRTPLTSIKWSTEALTSPSADLTQQKQQQYINQIHDSTERMIEQVNELLDATKIGLGTSSVNPSLVDLAPILTQVLEDLSAMTQDNKITVKQKIDKKLPPVWIDPTWMYIILQNLLSNAIKYSREGGDVDVLVEQYKRDVFIRVSDNGCGIPANQQDKIFGKLFRADNAKRIIGEGSGLGLYITKALVEQFGGEIWFESIENQGAVFYVKLPIESHKSA